MPIVSKQSRDVGGGGGPKGDHTKAIDNFLHLTALDSRDSETASSSSRRSRMQSCLNLPFPAKLKGAVQYTLIPENTCSTFRGRSRRTSLVWSVYKHIPVAPLRRLALARSQVSTTQGPPSPTPTYVLNVRASSTHHPITSPQSQSPADPARDPPCST